MIHDAEQMVRKTEPGFSVAGISYEDAAVFEMLNAGETEGVFQMESGGMTQTAVNLQLESLEDIIAIISLYRPAQWTPFQPTLPTATTREYPL